MLLIAELVATLAAGLWAGAAFYIGFAEHPAALKVGVGFATAYFRHMSKRTAPLMMALAGISGLSAGYAWWQTSATAWLVGAVLMLGMFPFTAALIVPTNLKLIRIDPERQAQEAATLHAYWRKAHWARTVLGSIPFPLFVWLLTR